MLLEPGTKGWLSNATLMGSETWLTGYAIAVARAKTSRAGERASAATSYAGTAYGLEPAAAFLATERVSVR